MHSEELSLASNAFYVLGASYNSTATEIADLVDDAEFSSLFSEADLQKAKQTLLTPRLRLSAEISWLPELSDAQIARVIAKRIKLTDDTVLAAVETLPELAKVNLIADVSTRASLDEDTVSRFLAAWEWISPDEVLAFLKVGRRSAGLPEPDAKLLQTSLQDLKARHARVIVDSILRGTDPTSVMSNVVNSEVADGSPSALLPTMVKQYERRNERSLSTAADGIKETIEKSKSGGLELPDALKLISNTLRDWSTFARPVAGFYRWRGHSEPRTKALYYEIRAFLLDLVNNDGKLEEAKNLILWSGTYLALTEDLKKVSDKDLADVEELIADRRRAELFEPLFKAGETAKSGYREFAKVARKKPIDPSAPAPVGSFMSALKTYLVDGDPELAAVVARDLSLCFNNDHNDPALAYKVLHAATILLKSHTVSEETKARYREDSETLYRNWKLPELEKQKGNLSGMTTLVEQAMADAPPGIKGEFAELHAVLMKKRKESRAKLIGWGVVATIVGGIVVFNSNKPSTSNYSPSHSSSSNTSNGSYKPSTSNYSTSDTPSSSVGAFEAKPSVGTGRSLNRSELRYCIFQGKRLDLLRGMTFTNTAVDSFNTMVSDFNSRCANFRYGQSDMTQVEGEASTRSSQFFNDASAIAKDWK